jgi:Mrp family chromosome partitioning ATPase
MVVGGGFIMSKIMEAIARSSNEEMGIEYHLETMAEQPLFPRPGKQQLDEFERLADSLLNLSDENGGKSVVFTASARGEGCSYVSYNVARYLSTMLDGKVAWVDGNFIAPQKKILGQGIGFKTLLQHPERAAEIATGPDFVTIPHGEGKIKQTQLLSGKRYTNLIDSLNSTFAFTVIDAPAINESVDVGRFARPTLGVVLVVESRRLKYEVIQNRIDTVRSQGGRVLGTVLNRQTHDIPDFLYRKVLGM